MRLKHVTMAGLMTLRELARSRIVLLLLLTVPTLFYGLVALTTPDRTIAFRLPSVSDETLASASERSESLVFVGLGTVGLLTSFVAMTFVQKNADATRRLVLAGFQPAELVVARLGALVLVIGAVSAYATTALLPFFRPNHLAMTLAGFVAGGWVYGCYGLLVGALVRRELEGILCVTLLANIDAGWLQNPIVYGDAQHKAIIRALPAFFPSQIAMVSAFADHGVRRAVWASAAYGAAFLVLAVALFWRRTRVVPYSRPCSRSLL